MPRPPKPGDDKRGLRLRVRVSADEKRRVEALAKERGLTPSDFVRVTVLAAVPKRKVPDAEREALLQLHAELNKNGSNLNQIARVLNIHEKSGDPLDLPRAEVEAAVRLFMLLANRLRKLLDHGH